MITAVLSSFIGLDAVAVVVAVLVDMIKRVMKIGFCYLNYDLYEFVQCPRVQMETALIGLNFAV
jgi:hypothetical protein